MVLCCCRLYPKRIAVGSIFHYAAPGRITYQQAVQEGTFMQTHVGECFGPTYVYFKNIYSVSTKKKLSKLIFSIASSERNLIL